MKTRKTFLLAMALVLMAGLGAGAMGQGKTGSVQGSPPEPIEPSAHVNAIEVTDGVVGFDLAKSETAFGYAFLGRTTGSLPGSFTLSMNCTPAAPLPGETSEMTGGSWTLPVYMTNLKGGSGYAGSLYGTIANGSMNWEKSGSGANVYAVLNIDGGTQTWDGAQGFATFVGTIFVDEKTQKTMLTGDLVFTITSGGKE